jgi:endonuclease/exonuclease/phosphatase (EEP) superfamily protein YafD
VETPQAVITRALQLLFAVTASMAAACRYSNALHALVTVTLTEKPITLPRGVQLTRASPALYTSAQFPTNTKELPAQLGTTVTTASSA